MQITSEIATTEITKPPSKLEEFAEMVAASVAKKFQKPSSEATVQELFDFYYESHAKRRCRSSAWMAANFGRYFNDLAELKAIEVTPRIVQEWHNSIGSKHGEPTANRALTLLRAMYNRGIKFELIDCRNPANRIDRFPEQQRNRVVSEAEMPKLMAAIDYCVLALLLVSVLTKRLHDSGLEMEPEKILDSLSEMEETVLVYPAVSGKRQFSRRNKLALVFVKGEVNHSGDVLPACLSSQLA